MAKIFIYTFLLIALLNNLVSEINGQLLPITCLFVCPDTIQCPDITAENCNGVFTPANTNCNCCPTCSPSRSRRSTNCLEKCAMVRCRQIKEEDCNGIYTPAYQNCNCCAFCTEEN